MIQFDHVSFRLPHGRTLLEDLNLSIAAGETLVLLGRSGCGKTTTMRMVNRLLEPTGGTIRVEGRSTREWPEIALRRRIGYVIQEAGLFPHYTVEDNVALVPTLEGWDLGHRRGRVRELLALVGLDPETYRSRFPRELSGGQRQRVGIARALAADPPIMLLDEPFSALDPITRRDLQRVFKGLQTRLGKTSIFVTHDVAEALFLGTRIALLKEGRLVFLGTPAEFLADRDPEVRAFVETIELGDGEGAA